MTGGDRGAWRVERRRIETEGRRHTPVGVSRRHWRAFDALVRTLAPVLHLGGLYRRGVRNALDLDLARVELVHPDLPEPFDGYRILHLSDLHVDFLPATTERAIELVRGAAADLCVITGDFRAELSGPFEPIAAPLSALLAAVRAPDGVFGVLGNHDDADSLAPIEALGVRMLVNESAVLERAGARLVLTGTDDPHYFYTPECRAALESAPDGFRVALVHTPELADHAARAGHRVYLCGHTHGGQICLPGGRPIVTHLVRCTGFVAGAWRFAEMLGYTNRGTGVSLLPVRFNSRGEVALLTLRRAAAR